VNRLAGAALAAALLTTAACDNTPNYWEMRPSDGFNVETGMRVTTVCLGQLAPGTVSDRVLLDVMGTEAFRTCFNYTYRDLVK
jgi:hypothetical protein